MCIRDSRISVSKSRPLTLRTDSNVQFDDSLNKPGRRVKKLKSHTSSEISRAINDSENEQLNFTGSTEELSKFNKEKTLRRSSIASQHSAVSNDTYNSEYSTDAQSGFRSTITQSSGRFSAATEAPNIIKKNVRRSLSILSSTSSNSEMSSRTDSFYDITTASSPMNMDIRSNYNTRAESQFPKMNGNSPWLIKRGKSPIGRHSRISNRSLNRKLRHTNTTRAQSIIQEESSFDENDRSAILPEVNEYDSAEIAIQSDSETPSKANSPIYPIGIDSHDNRPSFLSVGRSLSLSLIHI